MSPTRTPHDALDILARHAPSPASVCAEWSSAISDDVLASIIGNGDTAPAGAAGTRVDAIPLRFVPTGPISRRRRWATSAPLTASVAALAVAACAIVAVLPSHGPRSQDAVGRLGPVFDPPLGLSTASLKAGQYSHRVDQQIDLKADGKPDPHGRDVMTDDNWVAPNGDVVSIRTGSQNACYTFPRSGAPGFAAPTQSFFESLPTDLSSLNKYLRSHVEGSTSRDEAVFVAIGDALRTADGLASPRLRGAMVAVLSRTPGVVVHQDTRDYLSRPAVRADFIDNRNRPGEIHSLYFDPNTFQLLEDREGNLGQAEPYTGPSAPYGNPVAAADSPVQLVGAAYLDVMTSEKIVDKLPILPSTCTTQ